MSGTIWTAEETTALVTLARDGKSSAEIAAALTRLRRRKFGSHTVRMKVQRLRAEGVDIPRLGGKPGRPAWSVKPKRDKQANGEHRRRRTSTIAGYPTIQIRRDVEGNTLAPVTLRRIDFGGAHA